MVQAAHTERERIVATMDSERTARDLMTVFAGELGATYDSIYDEYHYMRSGTAMCLAIRLSPRPNSRGIQAVVYIRERGRPRPANTAFAIWL